MTGATSAPARPDRPLAGIGLNVLSTFLFAVETLMMKWLTADYPVMQVLLLRSVFALIPSFVLLRMAGPVGWATLRTDRPWLHLARVAMGAVAMLTFYTSITLLPLADAVGISFSAPLFMTALALPILGERVGPRRWFVLGIGFAGVLVMVRPGGDVLLSGALLCVVSSVAYAGAMIFTRFLGTGEPAAKLLVYGNLFAVALAATCMATRWQTPPMADMALMAGVGLVAGCAQLALVMAYRSAPIGTVAPFDYVALVWAALFGFVVFAEVPNWLTLLGSAIVAGSGITIVLAESRRGRQTSGQ